MTRFELSIPKRYSKVSEILQEYKNQGIPCSEKICQAIISMHEKELQTLKPKIQSNNIMSLPVDTFWSLQDLERFSLRERTTLYEILRQNIKVLERSLSAEMKLR